METQRPYSFSDWNSHWNLGLRVLGLRVRLPVWFIDGSVSHFINILIYRLIFTIFPIIKFVFQSSRSKNVFLHYKRTRKTLYISIRRESCTLMTYTGLGSDDEVRLIQYLFDEHGYNPLIRPVRNLTNTVTVMFGMAMIQLINIVRINIF